MWVEIGDDLALKCRCSQAATGRVAKTLLAGLIGPDTPDCEKVDTGSRPLRGHAVQPFGDAHFTAPLQDGRGDGRA